MEPEAGAPLVVFTSQPNSHPFQERHITIQDTIKIGRSVARAHPSPTNAIFDCKVLSRNHARLWFEDNKFYLQDTKSSNGTFVNNQRLSKGSEESDPHEIFSGDIIQFGVDVMENSKRVTHGCIIASITCYLPDGTEAKPRFSGRSQASGHSLGTVHSQEMYQLQSYLQEALHREQILQDKMSQLQSLLNTTSEACESSWHALINEDRLLSKLEVLQNQLAVFSKNQTESNLQQQIINMEEERLVRETNSKQSLRKVLEEKIQTIQELSDVKRSLSDSENECGHLREVCEDIKQQLQELSEKYDYKILEYQETAQKLQEAEALLVDQQTKYAEEKELLESKLEDAYTERDALLDKVNLLQSQEYEKSKQDLSRLIGNGGTSTPQINGDYNDDGIDDDDDDDENQENHAQTQKVLLESLQFQLEDAQRSIDDYQAKLDSADQQLAERNEEVKSLNQQLENMQLEVVEYVTKVAKLEERLKSSADLATDSLCQTNQLDQSDGDTTVISRVNVEDTTDVLDLREKLANAQSASEDMKSQIQTIQVEGQKARADQLQSEQQLHSQSRKQVDELKVELDDAKKEIENQTSITLEYRDKTAALEEKLVKITEAHKSKIEETEKDNSSLLDEISNNKRECEALKNECNSLKTRVQAIEAELQRLQQDNTQLDDELAKTNSQNKHLTDEITKLKKSYEELKELKDSLETQQLSLRDNLTDTQKETTLYKKQLDGERLEREQLLTKYEQSMEELNEAREKMNETQLQHSKTQGKLEALKNELATVNAEYKKMAEKSNLITLLSPLPVVVLVIAVVLAIYPFLSRITATSEHPL